MVRERYGVGWERARHRRHGTGTCGVFGHNRRLSHTEWKVPGRRRHLLRHWLDASDIPQHDHGEQRLRLCAQRLRRRDMLRGLVTRHHEQRDRREQRPGRGLHGRLQLGRRGLLLRRSTGHRG